MTEDHTLPTGPTRWRKSIRLAEYDYSQAGAYFITICTKHKKPYFEAYPDLKAILQMQWNLLPKRFQNLVLDAFVPMPNHVHGVLFLNEHAGSSSAALGSIVGAFKSICVVEWLKFIKLHNLDAAASIWQPNYYEHIIRNETELDRIREYVANNPYKWGFDKENLDHVIDRDYVTQWEWLERGTTKAGTQH